MTDALAIDTPADEATLEAWIWRLVVNAARSHRRKRTPTPTANVGDRATPAPDDAGELQTLVARLPERQRLAVFLRYYADLDYAAIGTALGVRTGTVSATLAAGVRSLRRMAEEVKL
jgi:RNA polymerase sigma factor (sigma-70 family)